LRKPLRAKRHHGQAIALHHVFRARNDPAPVPGLAGHPFQPTDGSVFTKDADFRPFPVHERAMQAARAARVHIRESINERLQTRAVIGR